MEREAGTSMVEKQRLRDAIEDQVQRYLERGGRITVIQSHSRGPAKSAIGGGWIGGAGDGADLMEQLD